MKSKDVSAGDVTENMHIFRHEAPVFELRVASEVGGGGCHEGGPKGQEG